MPVTVQMIKERMGLALQPQNLVQPALPGGVVRTNCSLLLHPPSLCRCCEKFPVLDSGRSHNLRCVLSNLLAGLFSSDRGHGRRGELIPRRAWV
jgi:hypothetical protein